jgi:hypothetical protein
MEEDYVGSQGTECTVVLEDKEVRSRKRGRRGKGGTRGGRKTRTTPRRIPSSCMHFILLSQHAFCINSD